MQSQKNIARWAAGVPLLLVIGLAVPGLDLLEPTQNAPTVAWVNTTQIMQQAPGYTQAESTFAGEMQSFQTEVQRMQAELDSLISNFDRTSLVLSPSAREQREEELRRLQQTNTQRAQQLQLQAQRRERELVGPIEERVSSVIEGLRAERNIGMIFDVSSPGSSVVAADRALDLTATVIQRLRSQQ